MAENVEALSDEELSDQMAIALQWKYKEKELRAETIRRIKAKRIYVEIVCPVCDGSGKTGQPLGGDPFDTKCKKCNGVGYIQGYLKE